MASVGAIGVYRVARLLVSIHRVYALHTLSAVESWVRLHAASVAHAWRWPSTNRPAVSVAVDVAVALCLLMREVAAVGRVAALIVVSAAAAASTTVVAASSASVSAHYFGLVDTHRLGAASVFAINGGLKRADCVERALPPRASGVGEIRIGYAQLDDDACAHGKSALLTNGVASAVIVLERAERLERGLLERGGDWRALLAHMALLSCRQRRDGRDILGWSSTMAALGFALVVTS